MTRIVLIRHGESQSQAGGYLAAHSCKGLSDLGRQQAAALRGRLARGELGEVHALYSSVMRRAVETAEIIAPAIGGLEPTAHCDLCEIHHGECDGMAYDEFEERYPAPNGWDPDLRRAPGEETFNEMAARVERAFARLVADHEGETVVVACHGGVVYHSLVRRLGLDRLDGDGGAWLHPRNTSITEWAYGESPWTGHTGWELVRYNDHSHIGLPPGDGQGA